MQKTGASIAGLILLLAGCSSTPVEKIVTVPQMIYPTLPDVALPAPPPTKDVRVNFCNSATAATDTFVCLSKEAWVNLAFNIQSLKQYILALQARIKLVNDERANWRQKNKVDIPTPPIPPQAPPSPVAKK